MTFIPSSDTIDVVYEMPSLRKTGYYWLRVGYNDNGTTLWTGNRKLHITSTANGIVTVAAEGKCAQQDVYDLSGRRVGIAKDRVLSDGLPKGIYIVDGKKVIVK